MKNDNHDGNSKQSLYETVWKEIESAPSVADEAEARYRMALRHMTPDQRAECERIKLEFFDAANAWLDGVMKDLSNGAHGHLRHD